MTLTERHCCDGLCVQGRDCPRKPRQKPARLPREQRPLFVSGRRFWPLADEWSLVRYLFALDLASMVLLAFSIWRR